MNRKRFCEQPFLLLIVIALVARAQTFGNPVIEFDEQFYLVVGDRMLHGAVPYLDIWDRKPVGLFVLFAAMRWIGGLFGDDGVLSYQLVAALIAAATARGVGLLAERLGSGRWAGIVAGIGYILWLDLLQGEGGQASVFYTLPMVAAALITLDVGLARDWTMRRPGLAGAAAMALVGLAIQIKYTVIFEGALFGLWLLWAGRRREIGWPRLIGFGGIWIITALFPTALVIAGYAALGQFDAFMFANFYSGFARAPTPMGATLGHLVTDMGIVSLPLIAALLGLRPRTQRSVERRFLISWIGVAGAAILLVGTFSPHYFIPFAAPIMAAAALWFERARALAITLMVIAALSGQALLGFLAWSKGGRAEAEAMVAAIGPVPRCLYVHDGYPILYLLTRSCLPSRFIFPGHLNTATEADALGVDSVAEAKRILASAPDAIVTDLPVFEQGNRTTQALVVAELARHYALRLRLRTGRNRYRLVYRRRPEFGQSASTPIDGVTYPR